MKFLLLMVLPVCLSVNINPHIHTNEGRQLIISSQAREGRMTAIEFKSQQYCRAELKDFEFDVRFDIVAANVYFTGANFERVEMGKISNSSLKPLAAMMAKCIPGTIVVFDDVKITGPDKTIRSIPGVTYLLY